MGKRLSKISKNDIIADPCLSAQPFACSENN